MINKELLIDGNIISQEDLKEILNPLNKEQVKKYAKYLTLSGLMKDIKDYIEKISSFLATGDTESFSPGSSIRKETKTVTLYRYQVKDLDGNIVWQNCTPDKDGAQEFKYTYTVNVVENNRGTSKAIEYFINKQEGYSQLMADSLYCYIDDIENKKLAGLYYADLNDFFSDYFVLQDIFLKNPFMTNRVISELILDIINNLNDIKDNNEQNYKQGKYFDKAQMRQKLDYLKAMYIAYYNAYEKACNMGLPGSKTTDGSELDRE